SDPHLTRGPLAAQPAAGLAGAIGRLLSIEPRPDCVVITGDLADTGHPVEYPQATIVIANSWVHGSPAGYLGPDQLAWIDRVLGARPDVPALVGLHHPPL